mgnify:CR=1 FL=1
MQCVMQWMQMQSAMRMQQEDPGDSAQPDEYGMYQQGCAQDAEPGADAQAQQQQLQQQQHWQQYWQTQGMS